MLSNNLALLEKKFPYLSLELKNPGLNDIELEIVTSKTGLPVARVGRGGRRVYLNSPYDPELEVQRWLGNLNQKVNNCLIINGIGFLYHLKALIFQNHFKRIVVYEPCLDILKACLQRVDWEPVLANLDFLLVVGNDFRRNAEFVLNYIGISNFGTLESGLKIFSLPAYHELFKSEIMEMQNGITELLRLIRVNLNTNHHFSEKWFSNGIKNLNAMVESTVISRFFEKLSGIPAIIVSAGPSLEKNIHLLKEIKGKALIICAGSSIRAMLQHGIQPHFLVATDGGEVNGQIYEDVNLYDTYLVYNSRFYHEVVNRYPGPKILMKTDTESFPDLFINGEPDEIGTLKSGLSVAHSALDLAVKIGCNPIVLVGQDLAFSGNKFHAGEDKLSFQGVGDDFLVRKDIYGRDVFTHIQFESFKLVFERMITELGSKITVINATEGGLPVQGAPNRKLDEVITEYCQEERDINNRIRFNYTESCQETKHRKTKYISIIEKLKLSLNRSITDMIELVERLQELRRFVYYETFELAKYQSALQKIFFDYDTAVNGREFDILLKDLRESKLLVIKLKINETVKTSDSQEYDMILYNYLNFINETKNYLGNIRACILECFPDQVDDFKPLLQSREFETIDWETLENQIKKNNQLFETKNTLDLIISQNHDSRVIGMGLYLQGLILAKENQIQKAIEVLKNAVSCDNTSVRSHFLLIKLWKNQKNFIKSNQSLEQCLQFDFKTEYCLRRLIKNHFLSRNYIEVNNIITRYQDKLVPQCFFNLLLFETLYNLGLHDVARKTYCDLVQISNIPQLFKKKMKQLSENKGTNQYRETYMANREYFYKRGVICADYDQIRYKAFHFLKDVYIYDCHTGQISTGVQVSACDLTLFSWNTLIIHDTNDIGIFKRLQAISAESHISGDKDILEIPVFVVAYNMDQWFAILQLFDFQLLSEWVNMYFYIGITEKELENVFLDVNTPIPNVLYGTGPERFNKFLDMAINKKEDIYLKQLNELTMFYKMFSNEKTRKIMIISSIKDNLLLHYSKMIHSYLNKTGYICSLLIQKTPYFRFNKYTIAAEIYDFQPDLVINISPWVQEGWEVFNKLTVPFISWHITGKSIIQNVQANCSNQWIIVTGNPDTATGIMENGYHIELNSFIPLPINSKKGIERPVTDVNAISIIGDSENFEAVCFKLGTKIFNEFSAQQKIVKSEVISAVRFIYAALYKEYDNERLIGLENHIYEELLSKTGRFKGPAFKNIADLLKYELEQMFFKSLQSWWLIEERNNYEVRIYGEGWKNTSFKPYYKGNLDFLEDEVGFQEIVLKHKINVCIGNRINNRSYLQPDLLNGIALSGFFLVNDLMVKYHGATVLEPFAGLLITYGSREELLDKVAYFLSHEDERRERAALLQEHVLRNFNIETVLKKVLNSPFRNGLKSF